jgi:hypothetical protein
MYKVKFKWRNVAAIAACLAVTIFASCEPGDEPVDNGADITSFTFDGIVGEAVIDKDALTVTATADETVDISQLVPAFTLSDGATAEVDGTPQVSGTTAGDFTGTVTYIVKSSDSRLTNIWTVTVTKEQSEFIFPFVEDSFWDWTEKDFDDGNFSLHLSDNGNPLISFLDSQFEENGDDINDSMIVPVNKSGFTVSVNGENVQLEEGNYVAVRYGHIQIYIGDFNPGSGATVRVKYDKPAEQELQIKIADDVNHRYFYLDSFDWVTIPKLEE